MYHIDTQFTGYEFEIIDLGIFNVPVNSDSLVLISPVANQTNMTQNIKGTR